jgi:hypothetical protein
MRDEVQHEQEESKTGLPKEILSKVKKMKMGESKRDCPVCYEGFKKGKL